MAVSTYFSAGHAFGEEAALPLRFEIERWRVAVDRSASRRQLAPSRSKPRSMGTDGARVWQRYVQRRRSSAVRPRIQALVESRMDAFRKHTLESDHVAESEGSVSRLSREVSDGNRANDLH